MHAAYQAESVAGGCEGVLDEDMTKEFASFSKVDSELGDTDRDSWEEDRATSGRITPAELLVDGIKEVVVSLGVNIPDQQAGVRQDPMESLEMPLVGI